MRVAVLNGPNLNLLGIREPHLYGQESLEDIEREVRSRAEDAGVELDWRQTNAEAEFVELVQGLRNKVDGAIVNAAAYTHTSWAIRDALLAVQVPFVEVHLSNVFAREPERRHSVMADLAVGVIAGFGAQSYLLAFEAIVDYLGRRDA